jgi:hypothetical protein
MKVALCFIISYNHILHKEKIWRDWIEPNKDIINVYFHYKKIELIHSPWIRKHCIPNNCIANTTYFHVVPAYMSLLSYAFSHDLENKWFCLLTDSCVPIISPQKFRQYFLNYYYASIFKWRPSYWNIEIHQRANLKYLNKEYHLSNTPWFTLSRDHVHKSILFMINKSDIYNTVCKGGLANESIFAIILQTFHQLKNEYYTINESSTITDWNRMKNATSPHLFINGTKEELNKDIKFIENELQENKYAIFLRKVDHSFPDKIILDFQNHDFGHNYKNHFKPKTNWLKKIKKIKDKIKENLPMIVYSIMSCYAFCVLSFMIYHMFH